MGDDFTLFTPRPKRFGRFLWVAILGALASLWPPLMGQRCQKPPPDVRRPHFSGPLATAEFEVPFRAPKIIEGELCFLFSKDEIKKSAEPFRFSSVLKFLKRRPSLDAIRAFIHSRWGLVGIPVVSTMSRPCNVFIQFQSEDDLNKAMAREATEVDGVHYRVFRWSPEFKEDEEPSLVPVWVSLPGLPPHFYHSSFLKIFTAPFGKYICRDNTTRCATRTDGARVCVEMDAASFFWIGSPGAHASWYQEVVFETLPTFCTKCKKQGHSEKKCKLGGENTILN
ncbi:uncharacterized protein LOC121249521 [Juglans microcarpa x Juglans regia]|uniref:uncharacterized protein LOC121249521 n=1 Tax=Juglans microcarpa x Juglans regia TaxID=2249226 RepID=UPI001B7F5B33|nr:uncharacterized protein LOC121249521 [Juglans microcarpa x Juglans regia]